MDIDRYAIWFKEALADFKAGEALLVEHLLNLAAFHFVQSAEKSIKALLYLAGLRPWGHSITTLLEEYNDRVKTVDEEITNAALELEPHYISSRYPSNEVNLPPSEAYDVELVESLRECSRLVMEFVEREKDGVAATR